MSKQIMIVFGIVKLNSIANTAEVERVDRVDMHTPEEAQTHAAEVMESTSMYDSYIIPSLYSGSITWNEHQTRNNYNPPAKHDPEYLFLDYVNNFLTVAAFAEHYAISEEEALKTIEKGREINNSK
jgi:hypothetical protein